MCLIKGNNDPDWTAGIPAGKLVELRRKFRNHYQRWAQADAPVKKTDKHQRREYHQQGIPAQAGRALFNTSGCL